MNVSGNELSGSGVGVRVAADQYASDTVSLKNMIQDIYENVEPKPQIIAPGGFFDTDWFKEFIDKTPKSLDVITHHIYNLGPGMSTIDTLHELLKVRKGLFGNLITGFSGTDTLGRPLRRFTHFLTLKHQLYV